MPIQNDSLNRKLYDLLDSRGYNPVSKDSDVNNAGKTVPPEEADVFRFTFKQAGEPVDDAWISIDGANKLILYYDQDLANKTDERTPGTQFDDSWYGLLRHLKNWAFSKRLKWELAPKEKLDNDMAQRTYMKKKEQIAEGYYPMGKSASYNDNIPTVKIILQHTRQVQEGEQRYRNVAKIFLENAQGERFLSPTNKPGLAQVYARHLAEGGVPNDDRWNHLKSLCEEYSKMAGFVRAVRGNQFNESAQRVVEAGLSHYQSLRESLGKMRGHRGYTAYFESWSPPLMEDETDNNSLNELFVQETLDPRIESVMPILSKLSKNLGEMKEVNELAEWADSLVEGGDGGEASEEPAEQIDEAPGAETLAHNKATAKARLDAFHLDEDAIDDANKAAKKIATPAFMRKEKGGDWKVGQKDLDALPSGTRTTSQGLKAHSDRLKAMGELEEGGVVDTLKKVGGKILDKLGHGSDEDLIRDLQKKAGVPVTGKKPEATEKPVDEGFLDNPGQEDSPVANAITRRILMQRTDLLSKYGPEKVAAAIDDVAEFVGDVDEIGSSDVSGWVKQVERSLGGDLEEAERPGLWANIHAKRERIKNGSGEKMRKPGSKGAPTAQNFRDAAKEGIEEDLDANQKRVGQLGPTEKVAKNSGARGKLVGASENFINTDAQAVVTEMDSEGYKGTRDEDNKGPEGKGTPVKAKDAAKDAKKVLDKAMDKAHKKDVKEGQDDLAAMLRIINR